MKKPRNSEFTANLTQFDKNTSFHPLTLAVSVRDTLRSGLLRSCLATALMASGAVRAETIHINSNCSLIEAINAANNDVSIAGCRAGKNKDRLVLPAKTFVYSKAFDNRNAFPKITSDIVIDGNGASLIRDNKAGNFRFFYVDHSAQLTLKDLTLKGGKQGPGGAVFVQYAGKLRIQDSVLTENNSLDGKGGAIESRGDVTISRSVISHNSAGFSGGGIHITEGSLKLDSSTVSHNHTDGVEGGAGITILGRFESEIINSTISGNSATSGSGGGIRIRTSYPGEVSIVSSTIAANSALESGAGIKSSGDLQLSHSIVSGNQARTAPEISASGYIVANAYNLFGHSGHAGLSGITLFGADVVPDQAFEKIVAPLSDNGGKTPTHSLISGSSAINAGGRGYPLPSTDQRGVPRPQGQRVDIGSVEAVNIPQATGLDINNTIFADGKTCSLRNAITAALTDKMTGGCSAGVGPEDTIALLAANVYQISQTLPTIPSGRHPAGGNQITIEGNGATITAYPGKAPMQFFHVAGSSTPETHTPILRLKNLTLSGAIGSAVSVIKGQVELNHTTISDSHIGVIVKQDADLFINASTIANNRTVGIAANSNSLLVVASSTISGNGWPGLMVGPLAQLKMTDTTVSANGGRGLVLNSRYHHPELRRNLIAGNGHKLGKNKNREIIQNRTALQWKGGFNLLGYDGISGSFSSTLTKTDIVPKVSIDQIILPLEQNGGLTKTHALANRSPAIDVAGIDCAVLDQRGILRPQMKECDAGSFEASEL